MKQQVLFVQGGAEGAYATDGELVASLQRALGNSYEIRYPKMPDEDDPDYEKWKPAIAEEMAKLKGVAILVGHSLGGSFLLKFLVEEKPQNKIAGIFLMAAPYWGGEGWRYDGYQRAALPKDFASRLPRDASIFMYHGSKDGVVPLEHLSLYAAQLPQAHTRRLEGDHQLNNDLSEVAADIIKLTG